MNKLKNNSKPLIWLMGLLLTVFVAGCGSGGDGGGGATAQPGTLGVSMTDAPACGFDEVNVTVSKVRVHQSGNASENAAGWTDITLNPARKINLLDLNNGALESLGETSLVAGHYTQLRLVLVPNANSVVLSGPPPSTEIPLDTPSGIQSGIKLIHQFTVNSGQRVDLLLDFDACKSIVKTGSSKYKLQPVIKVIPYVLNGIKGFVHTNLLGSNVVVSAQRGGEIFRATVPNTLTGEFFLARLPGHPGPADYPANYDVVITADGHETAVIASVPVQAAPSITTISTTIGLNGSSTHSISGTVTLTPETDEASVFVAAKQTLVSGPPVTVKSQVAALKTDPPPATIGDYEYNLLPLPTAAPSLYQYNATTQAITLDPANQSTVAGAYTIHGSARTDTTVYTVQNPPTLSASIISGDQSNQNFMLTPTP
jgi:hypothetical protein